MKLITKQQQAMLDKQVESWVAELRRESSRLAELIAAATGRHYAVIMVSGTDPAYADVIPDLIVDDVLRVHPHGRPEGFDIQLLNPASGSKDDIDAMYIKRMAAMEKVFGAWKDQPGAPKDGLEYQNAIRAEWDR